MHGFSKIVHTIVPIIMTRNSKIPIKSTKELYPEYKDEHVRIHFWSIEAVAVCPSHSLWHHLKVQPLLYHLVCSCLFMKRQETCDHDHCSQPLPSNNTGTDREQWDIICVLNVESVNYQTCLQYERNKMFTPCFKGSCTFMTSRESSHNH